MRKTWRKRRHVAGVKINDAVTKYCKARARTRSRTAVWMLKDDVTAEPLRGDQNQMFRSGRREPRTRAENLRAEGTLELNRRRIAVLRI